MRPSIHERVRGFLLRVAIIGAMATPASAADDCCTADATAKIAAKAGFVDVVGIKLGMTVKEAVAAAKRHNGKFVVNAPSPFRFDLLPNVGFVDLMNLRTNEASQEAVDLFLTMPPNQEFIWYVSRSINYDGDARPTAANVLTSLRQKYGQEDGSMMAPQVAKSYGVESIDAYWVFDANGKKVAPPQAKGYAANCTQGFENSDLTPLKLPPNPNQWVRNNINCGEVTMVFANWQPTMPMNGPPGLVLRLQVRAYNSLLHRSAFEASQALMQQAEGKQADKEKQKANQVKPAL